MARRCGPNTLSRADFLKPSEAFLKPSSRESQGCLSSILLDTRGFLVDSSVFSASDSGEKTLGAVSVQWAGHIVVGRSDLGGDFGSSVNLKVGSDLGCAE